MTKIIEKLPIIQRVTLKTDSKDMNQTEQINISWPLMQGCWFNHEVAHMYDFQSNQ